MSTRNLPLATSSCPPKGETCPYVSCRHHLAVERIERSGRIVWNASMGSLEDIDDDELVTKLETLAYGGCSLRAAGAGGIVNNVIADMLGISRERVRQMVESVPQKYRQAALRLRIDMRELWL